MKHSRISRVVNILTTFQSGQKYAPSDLEKLLGVSKRTVFRDLKELQSIGVSYKFNNKSGAYHIDPKFFLPPIDFNIQEAMSVLMLIHKMRHYLPLPHKNAALMAGLKIENNLPSDIRQHCQGSLAKITIDSIQHAPVKLLDNLHNIIQRAIKKKNILQLSYSSLYEKCDIVTIFHPYHLLYKNRAWYVIGHSKLYDTTRTFNLGRIKNIDITGKCFTDGDDFDIQEYIGRAWCLIPEGKLYDIKLLFSPLVARNVAEVMWHSTQAAKWNEDGSVVLNFRIDGLNEICWWVMGYGDQVQVIEPAVLRNKVVEKAQNLIKIYQK